MSQFNCPKCGAITRGGSFRDGFRIACTAEPPCLLVVCPTQEQAVAAWERLQPATGPLAPGANAPKPGWILPTVIAKPFTIEDDIAPPAAAAPPPERETAKALGHATWIENGKVCHAAPVDPATHGPHGYAGAYVGVALGKCINGCGCWMGGCSSGGPVDPFGPCPRNPVAPPAAAAPSPEKAEEPR